MAKITKRSKQLTKSMEWTHVQTLVVEEKWLEYLKEQDNVFLLESSEHGTCFYQYDMIDEHDIHATSCKQQW